MSSGYSGDSGHPPRSSSSRHRRSRSDGGFLPSPDQLGAPANSYGLPKSRLSSVRKAVDYGFDAIQEETSPRESLKESDLQAFSPRSKAQSSSSTSDSVTSHKPSRFQEASSSESSSNGPVPQSPRSSSSSIGSGTPGSRDGIVPRQPEGSRPPRPNAARHRRIRSEDIAFSDQWNMGGDSEGSVPSPHQHHGLPQPLPRPDSKGLPPAAPLKSPKKGGWSLSFGIPPKPSGSSSPSSDAESGGDSTRATSESSDGGKGGGGLGGIWDRRQKNKDKPADISSLSLSGWKKSPNASPKAGLLSPGSHLMLRTPPRSPKSPSPNSLKAAGIPKSPKGKSPEASYSSSPRTGTAPSPKVPSSRSREGGPLPFEGPGLVIPNRGSPFTSPYGSPFTSPKHGGIGASPRIASIMASPGPGSLVGSPSAMAAQNELDRVKLLEIQNMFQFKQSYQSPKAEGRGPFVAKPVRTPNVSDYYRQDQGSPQVYLPSMACVLRKPYRDIREFYRVAEKELGRGNFGVIRVAERLDTGERCAVKTISKDKLECWEDVEDVKRELQIMETLRGHPHIIQILESFEDHKEVHLVMELCEGGELFDRILERGYYAERQAAKVCRTMVEVLEHIHAKGIVHRDLKPENVLLISKKSDTRIKVIDFGMAIYVKPGERCRLRAGTPNYIAPEVIAKNYAAEADVWSVGVILYVLLCGLPPFWGDTTEDVFKSVLTQELDFETEPWPVVSIAAKDLVRRMLNRDYKKRITPTEILNHPWIKTLTS